MEPIHSGKHVYAVGQRGDYVYFLLQGMKNLTARKAEEAALIEKYSLTSEEVASLRAQLDGLDARRANPRPNPKTYRRYRRSTCGTCGFSFSECGCPEGVERAYEAAVIARGQDVMVDPGA